jgi:hypothetical protein
MFFFLVPRKSLASNGTIERGISASFSTQTNGSPKSFSLFGLVLRVGEIGRRWGGGGGGGGEKGIEMC